MNRTITYWSVLAAALAAMCLFTMTTEAFATSIVSSFGAGAGEVNDPTGVAVDTSNGHLYVADRHNYRVDVFGENGEFVMAFGWGVGDGTTAAPQNCSLTCLAGIAGPGKGQIDSLRRIAVNNDPSSPAYHDVYVDEEERVQEFTPAGQFVLMIGKGVNQSTSGNLCTAASGDRCGGGARGNGHGEFEAIGGIAVGPEGTLFVGDSDSAGPQEAYSTRVEEFDGSSGSFTTEMTLTGAEPYARMETLAVSPNGDFYASISDPTGTRKYDPSGNILFTLPVDASALTVDPAGNLFAFSYAHAPTVTEYSESGTELSVFGYENNFGSAGIAYYHSSTGDVYTDEEYAGSPAVSGMVLHIPLPPGGPHVMEQHPSDTGAAQFNLEATQIGNHQATLSGYLNPEGKPTTYHFQYVDQAEFQASGFSSPSTRSTAESPPVGSDFELHHAVANLTDLVPETVYHYRLIATNAEGVDVGPEATFETLPPLQIDGTWSTNVGTEGATLHVSVNPLGIATTGAFQYVDNVTYETSGFAEAVEVPDVAAGATPLDFGSGEASLEASIALHSLRSGASYRYRFVARDPFVAVYGPVHSLVTVRATTEPDVGCANQSVRTTASSVLPDCRAYEMVSPVEKNNTDIVDLINLNSIPVALDESSGDGEKLTYTTSQGFGDSQGTPYTSQYVASRGPDGWSSHGITPPQGLSAIEIGNRIDLEFRSFTEDLCSGIVLNATGPVIAPGAVEGYFNLYRRSNCGTEGYEALTTTAPPTGTQPFAYVPTVEGESSDGACTVFSARAPLTANASSERVKQVYESCDGHLYLVSVLPNGKAENLGAAAGTFLESLPPRGAPVIGAVSADGSHVYWTGAGAGPGKLYVRVDTTGEQSAVVAGKCTEEEKACTVTVSSEPAFFVDASSDGSRSLYRTAGEELFESTLEGDHAVSSRIAGMVGSVVGAGANASTVYFVSEEALSGANGEGRTPVAGAANLYLFDSSRSGSDRYRFIGALSGADMSGYISPVSMASFTKTSRVSTDGLHAVFMSTASLTDYDNADQASGEADREVFTYDATADGGAGRLSCVSCNPTGQRPQGHEIPIEGQADGGWAAALLPPYDTELYGSRVISDNGRRVFFDSYEALTAHDTDGTEDVYEWEAPGEGDCTEGSSAYSLLDDGCVSLISTGESPTDSEFLDASRTGGDVFFTTGSSLVPQDPGLIDIYDARVGGGYPAPQAPPASCEGETCQNPPTPPIDSTPASLSFSGEENAISEPVAGAVKSKAKKPTRAQLLARALKTCRRNDKAHRARKVCEQKTRAHYRVRTAKRAERSRHGGR